MITLLPIKSKTWKKCIIIFNTCRSSIKMNLNNSKNIIKCFHGINYNIFVIKRQTQYNTGHIIIPDYINNDKLTFCYF